MNKIKSLKHFIPLKLLIPILVISMLAIGSYAASVSISNPVAAQDVQGVVYNVTGGFSAVSNGFFVTSTAATASAQPGTWADTGIITTATVFGNWQYSLTVTIPALSVASPSTTYTVTVQWEQSGAGYSQMGTSLTFTTPAIMPTTAQTMTFVIDTSLATFTAPAGIVITVA